MTSILVDYDNHPAFNRYSHLINKVDTSVIMAIWHEIDRATKLVKESQEYLAEDFIRRYHEFQVCPFVDEILRITNSHMPSSAWFKEVVSEALFKTRETLLKEMLYENEKKRSVFQVTYSPYAEKVKNDLKNEGVSFTLLPQEYLDMVYDSIASDRATIEQMVHNEPGKMHSISLPMSGPYYQITQELLRAYGVFDGVTLHSRQPMEIIYVSLCLSCASQNWFRDCYEDVGVGTSKLAYLHVDNDFDIVKVLMYLKPVTHVNGPFRIIPGSAKFIASRAQSIFFKHLDNSSYQKIKRQRQDLDGYYRPVFKDPELRKEFMFMPKELRGSSHFGDDIIEGSEQSKELLTREVPLLSSFSNCATFTGSETFHRGGLTEQGQRWAFQIAMRKQGVGCGNA
jgi:hypothetical protein